MIDNKMYKVGAYISIIAWFIAWIILGFKLDYVTYFGFMLYGLGLSGIIIFILNPIIYEIRKDANQGDEE